MLHTVLPFIRYMTAAQGGSECASGENEIVCCNTVQSTSYPHTPPASTPPSGLHSRRRTLSHISPSTTGMSNAAAANLRLVSGVGKSCTTKQLLVCCTDNNYVSDSTSLHFCRLTV